MIVGITKVSSKGQIVIPVGIRGDLAEGDKLIVIKRDDEIILKKSLPENALLSEKSFAKTWLSKKEDEAWKEL